MDEQVSRPATAGAEAAREYLTFRLGQEEYGLNILNLQEIRGYDPFTKIANSPAFIKGAINMRGIIVPIIDIERLMTAEYMGLVDQAAA